MIKKRSIIICITIITGLLSFLPAKGQEKEKKKGYERPMYLEIPYHRPIFPFKKPEGFYNNNCWYSGWTIRISTATPFPQGEFAKTSPYFGFGFLAGASYQHWEKVPISFGFDLGWYWLGYYYDDDATLDFNITTGGGAQQSYHVPISVTISNGVLPVLAHVEAWVPTKTIQPFVGIEGGMNLFLTTTKIRDLSADNTLSNEDSDVIYSEVNEASPTYTYGGGGGLRINLASYLNLDLCAYYTFGGKAKYYDYSDSELWSIGYDGLNNPGTPSGDDIRVTIQPKQSATDMLNFKLRFLIRI